MAAPYYTDARPLQEALDAADMLPASKAAASSDTGVQFEDDKTDNEDEKSRTDNDKGTTTRRGFRQ